MSKVETQQGRVMVRLFGTFLGGSLIINAFLLRAFDVPPGLRSLSAFLGALFLATPVVLGAITSIVSGKVRMMELAALAIIASFALEEYETAGIVAFFMLLAEFLQTRTALGARHAIEGLIRLAPEEACRLDSEGQESKVLVSQLRRGDIVRVRPGENIPADGVVRQGQSAVNQAEITGESLPVDKEPGAEVFAGTNNQTGVLEIEVSKAGEDTTLGKVKELILQAEMSKTPLMRLIDRHVGWYTPTILMLTGMILYFSRDMHRAISALVVTCPSALILATPTALVAALSCAARLGILIKDVGYLEEAAQLNGIVFDKTGTLTTGTLSVTRLAPAKDVEGSQLLHCVASVEQFSNHPVAKAIVALASKANVALDKPENIQEVAGKGMTATVAGEKIIVGRENWLDEEGCDFSSLSSKDREDAGNYSVVYAAKNGRCIGWIGLEDTTRQEARGATEKLKELGCRNITMLTGDRWTVARRVADELGCTEVHAECLPETKLQLVEKMKDDGYRVAVVGDGVNDAPALASGNLGIAMGAAGNDIAINSASVALLNNNLNRLPFLIELARQTRNIIYQNLIFGALFIIGGLTLTGFGVLNPILGAILHNVGAFVIVFNSARLVRFGEHLE